jgi:hypothetical protein
MDGPAYLRRGRLTIVRPKPDPSTGVGSFFGVDHANAIEIDAASDQPALQIKATIKKSASSTPNPAEVTITNLAERTRDQLSAAAHLVAILETGYGSAELRQILIGDVVHVGHEADGPHIATKILVHDGGRAYAHARIGQSFRAGAPIVNGVKAAAQAMQLRLPAGVETMPELQQVATAGISMAGRASDEMSRLLTPFGLGWSIQDGALVVLSDRGIRPGEAIVIDEQAGMIGSPKWGNPTKGKKPPLTVQCLLFPELAVGGRVRVKSRTANGDFKVTDCQHQIDTHGGDWMTSVDCRAAG